MTTDAPPPRADADGAGGTSRKGGSCVYPPAAAVCDQQESPAMMALVLEDGTTFSGYSFGAEGRSVSGECVFQTGMVGYPESLTDPSYRGQILVLTYPLVGNYGVPARGIMSPEWAGVLEHFESKEVHIAALVVAQYSSDYSHYMAASSLGAWLKEQGVPAIFGVDTRALTKRVRERGALLGKLLAPSRPVTPPLSIVPNTAEWLADFKDVAWCDPNARNLVAEVSGRTVGEFSPQRNPGETASGPRILIVDVGLKLNQLRCFLKRGAQVRVVPWDHPFAQEPESSYDGLFVSNGPGDPSMLGGVVSQLRQVLERRRKPVFGICLGHQLLALAAGAQTHKMKFGNRGHNIPCTDVTTGRCVITSQNHGFAVDARTLPADWQEYFVNANDGSNEGIRHRSLPFFSVQFHPEAAPGPWDAEVLFDAFLTSVRACVTAGQLLPLPSAERVPRPIRRDPRKVVILGSGGLSIGQAGEFDYSGSQAIKALKEEGIYTILVNPNIATIQTSAGLADKVYFLPVTPDYVRKVLRFERPDGIYCTFGGQTALNVGLKLKGEFAGLGVEVLGTPIDTIELTEDRELFARAMLQIGERCAQSSSATTLAEALSVAKEIGYPVIVRAAYALGGLGSGFANDASELEALCVKAFANSPQVLVEKSMRGWKEIEYEVVRDAMDNCVTVCNMENFDPLGIHTGDSIVVAPSQTLSDADYMMLRRTAVNVVRHLGVVGECNIQYALNPASQEYAIIEVNARLSRSSALASKATGYPLAFVAAKLGLGIPLTEVRNSVTQKTIACFEPSLDYCVVKIPRWDLRKFVRVSNKISSSMKSVGEVMAIGRGFEETFQKAIRCIDYTYDGFSSAGLLGAAVKMDDARLESELRDPSDQRLSALAVAMDRGWSVARIHDLTRIDPWFLNRLAAIVRVDHSVATHNVASLPPALLQTAKMLGFSDRQLSVRLGSSEMAVRTLRKDLQIVPVVKQIDTVAAEFPCFTNYLYMTYNGTEHDVSFSERGTMVLGSGVYRIGSSVEFDWCAVRAIRTLRQQGERTVMVNYNPETVSTDYDEADRLYFENIDVERVLDIYEAESAGGVIVSMGGQTPNNIALPLLRTGARILGTSPEMIDSAENRYKFSRLLDKLGVDQPRWKELTSVAEAGAFCDTVGYPVLVRPSYVLSGAGMTVVYSASDLSSYLAAASDVSKDHPVVISKFIEEAKEIELDAVVVDGEMVYHVISEHVENAGVHSGDATLVQPPQDLDPATVRKVEAAARKITDALNVTGPVNMQFIAKNNEIKVIECNVRASRSFPFVSKVLGVDLAELATLAMMGRLPAQPPIPRPAPPGLVAVKVPQFSFSRLSGADPVLGVEMASTGEVACFGSDKYEAYLKSLLSTGFVLPRKNVLLSIGSYKEKVEFLPSVRRLHELGFALFATAGTADFIQEHNIPVQYLEALEPAKAGSAATTGSPAQRDEYSLTQHLANNLIDLYINLPSRNQFRRPASYMSRGYRSRRLAVDLAVPLITNIKCAKLFVEALARYPSPDLAIGNLDAQTSHRVTTLPGLVNITAVGGTAASPDAGAIKSFGRRCLAGGMANTVVLPPSGSAWATLEGYASARAAFAQAAVADFALAFPATAATAAELARLSPDATPPVLFLDLDEGLSATDAGVVLSVCARSIPIVVRASGAERLAALLFFCGLHRRAVHVTQIRSEADLDLVLLARASGLPVTCDVAAAALMAPTAAGTALRSRVSEIDAVSIPDTGDSDCFAQALTGLLQTLKDGSSTINDLVERLHSAPSRILGVPRASQDTYIEVDLGGSALTPVAPSAWSAGVHRVVVHGETVYLDGKVTAEATGADFGPAMAPSSAALPPLAPLSSGGKPPGIDSSTPAAGVSSAAVIRRNSLVAATGKTAVSDDASGNLSAGPTAPSAAGVSVLVPGSSGLGSATGPMSSTVPAATPSARFPQQLPSVDTASDTERAIVGPSSFPATALPLPALVAARATNAFFNKSILSVAAVTRTDLHVLFGVAQEMRVAVERQGGLPLLVGRVLASAFFEPSTRTSASFETAMLRLGGQVVQVRETTSSAAKGESLADTVRTLSCYADVIAIRHPDRGAAALAAKYARVPVLNAGDGIGEHPTQAFLDTFTIREELGTVNGLTITLLGDLKHGRTVHSLVRLLAMYSVRLRLVSPETLRMPEEIRRELSAARVEFTEHTDLSAVLSETDVLYVTRIQKERFASVAEYEAVQNAYVVDGQLLRTAKRHMIVMHPLPRVREIDPEVDFDQRAAYFRQMRYGLYVRMALLALVCWGRSG